MKKAPPENMWTVFLTCPGFGHMSDLAKIVFKEGFTNFLLHHTDPVMAIDDEWYYSLTNEYFYDDEGEPKTLYNNPAEQEGYYKDHYHIIKAVRDEVATCMQLTVFDNEVKLRELYERHPETIDIIKTFDNHLLLLIRGK